MSRGPRKIGQVVKNGLRLSLCMIVKNEAETLEKCLSNARPYVDEIVVVDTGSTDGTQDIVQRYADIYDEIEWPDSFSIARNYSIDKATGDFILVLDGDEYIEGAHYWKRIRKALKQPDLAALQFPVKNLLHHSQIVSADRMWQERVMRNDKRIRYSGRVHNQIQEAIFDYMKLTGTVMLRIEAEVVHIGYAYSKEKMLQKYEPRIKLLKQEYEYPRSEVYRAYYGYQLGVAYFVTLRLEEAAMVLNEIDYRQLNPDNAFYTHLLAAQTALRLNNANMALIHCDAMLTLNRKEPVAYYTTGLALLLARKIYDGMLMLLEAYNVNDDGGLSIRFILNPGQVIRSLARVCGQVGLKDHQKVFQALADSDKCDPKYVKPIIESLKTGIVFAELDAAA